VTSDSNVARRTAREADRRPVTLFVVAISADELIQRNARFAAGGTFAGLQFPTNQTLRVVGCVDSRVDPSHVLGLELGDAVVMRNIGGRVTPAVLRSWALLAKLGQVRSDGQSQGGPPHMVILHHTDCGIRQLAAYPELLAEFFEIAVADLDAKMVNDPRAAVGIDVEIVRRTLPPGLLVSGLVYDTDTGHVEIVVPPTTA
jgi:carbonic anhydrase